MDWLATFRTGIIFVGQSKQGVTNYTLSISWLILNRLACNLLNRHYICRMIETRGSNHLHLHVTVYTLLSPLTPVHAFSTHLHLFDWNKMQHLLMPTYSPIHKAAGRWQGRTQRLFPYSQLQGFSGIIPGKAGNGSAGGFVNSAVTHPCTPTSWATWWNFHYLINLFSFFLGWELGIAQKLALDIYILLFLLLGPVPDPSPAPRPVS